MIGSVVIVGAGIAGLAAAVDLSARGIDVTIVERDPKPGGKMREVILGGVAVDTGPTVLTMVGVFADLIDEGCVGIERADVLARHFWPDGSRLDLFGDIARTAAGIATLAGEREADGYRAFVTASGAILHALRDTFMTADKPATPLSLMWRGGLRGLPGFARLDPYRSLSAMVAEHFRDPRLRQLFGRYTTYCGSSPVRAPATLALIAEVEREGVWLVSGGMSRLADALLDTATARGARARFGCGGAGIAVDDGRAVGVWLDDGTLLPAETVLLTADAAALAAGRFGQAAARGRRRFAPRDRSYSAVTIAAVADAAASPLCHHNIFFSADGPAEFAALDAGRLPDAPTVYLCAQARNGSVDAPAPGEAEPMLMVLNAPADGDTHTYSQAEIDRCTTAALATLASGGLTLNLDPSRCSISTPSDFERRFPATGGALYGRASHGWTASFARPGARTGVRGLYLAGGSVHPGAGVPMAALSGRAAVRAILNDRGSTSTFPRAAMPGGTLMRSATADVTA